MSQRWGRKASKKRKRVSAANDGHRSRKLRSMLLEESSREIEGLHYRGRNAPSSKTHQKEPETRSNREADCSQRLSNVHQQCRTLSTVFDLLLELAGRVMGFVEEDPTRYARVLEALFEVNRAAAWQVPPSIRQVSISCKGYRIPAISTACGGISTVMVFRFERYIA